MPLIRRAIMSKKLYEDCYEKGHFMLLTWLNTTAHCNKQNSNTSEKFAVPVWNEFL